MIHVVIVEDEMLVRLGTKLCLEEYEGEKIQVKGLFESAEDAFEYFQNQTADVLITDVKLGGMSGLDLIRRIRTDHMHMKVIVLSCYEDFSYAREAMELGVDKYLLKHELTGDDLSKAVLEIAQKKSVSTRVFKNTNTFSEPVVDAQEFCYTLGYLIIRGEQDDTNCGPEQMDMHMLSEIIQKLLNVGNLGECFLRHEQEIFILFRLEQSHGEKELEEKIYHFYQRLTRNILGYFNKNIYLFLSPVFETLNCVMEMFLSMKKKSAYSFYYDSSCLVFSEQENEKSKVCPALKMSMEDLFSERWVKENKKQIEKFFLEVTWNQPNSQQVKAEAVRYFYSLQEKLSGRLPVDYKQIDTIDSAKHLRMWLENLLDEAVQIQTEQQDIFSQIKGYICKHYNEEINLEKISNEFHMSMPYFCQFFKKKSGSSFVTYLNNYRIEYAKVLLHDQKLTIEEISCAVGIPNPNYFIRLFKKITGETVGTYRKNLK